MKKVLKFIKKQAKLIIGIVVGACIASGSAYAVTAIAGSNVGYTDTNNIGATTVQGAIDKLYEKAQNIECKKGYKKYNETSSGYECKDPVLANYVKAYTYNATSCVTGNESTCVETECYKTKTAGSCPAGTIIKYKVNDTTTETFHVMYDRANSITMQTQKNTVYSTAWYSSVNNNSQGPLTILPALESATSSWTNVEDQTYTMGTTNFPIGDEGQFPSANSGTSCTATSCSGNKYTLATRTAKARMITVQETAMLGCTGADQSCPNWMNNYLYQSTRHGGTIDDNEQRNSKYNFGYWTMSANSSDSNYARDVGGGGCLGSGGTSFAGLGARAVVVVSK